MSSDDLDQLREEFPTWRFGTIWVSAASGPDARRLWASKGTVRLAAWDAAGLRMAVTAKEVNGGGEHDRTCP
jgi:hypothetical protein